MGVDAFGQALQTSLRRLQTGDDEKTVDQRVENAGHVGRPSKKYIRHHIEGLPLAFPFPPASRSCFHELLPINHQLRSFHALVHTHRFLWGSSRLAERRGVKDGLGRCGLGANSGRDRRTQRTGGPDGFQMDGRGGHRRVFVDLLRVRNTTL